MKDFNYLIQNFFTHKDFLAPANQIPGTMFTPLHFVFAAVILSLVILACVLATKRKHLLKKIYIILWAAVSIIEVIKITYESTTGKTIGVDLQWVLPLYPCSLYMYAMPFAIWGKGNIKWAACGYVCTIALMGGAINFAYPMTVLPFYSCISFIGMHTFLYHGVLLFTAVTMLSTGYHTFSGVTKWWQIFLASIPALIFSIPANIVSYAVDADYMFFRGNSAFLPLIFGDVPDVITTIIIYVLYIIVPAAFYLPSYIAHKRKERREKVVKKTA
ncbi:MAG: hypothetical protein E7340_00225 [Clostridiales bacterium]|nr:hypothetical protein [Clostridiales bacterium]